MNESEVTSGEGSSGPSILSHIPRILWHRRWLIVIPLVLLSAAGIVAAQLLPATYRSSATLLVESQDLPADVVDVPERTFIDQRIAKIRAQALSRGDLIELIQQNNLYPEERQKKPLSSIVEKVRSAISIEAVSANIGQGQNRSNTIAFSMSFDYHEPVPAQLVVQEFARRFLDLDSSQMAEQAQSTVTFLTNQSRDLQQQIADIEGQITGIKAQNGLALSGGFAATVVNAGGYDAQIAALRRENAMLARQPSGANKDPVVAAAEAQLAAAQAVYSESHPDVRLARQRLQEARRLAGPRTEDNSSVREQIQANNAEIAALERARASELAQVASARGVQSQAPVLMERIAQLENRADSLREQHKAVSERLLTARTAAQMEEEQKGERLSLIEAPVVPDQPISPNRPLLMLGGVAGGLMLGLLLALAVEMVLRPIRSAGDVERLTGVSPLGVIPTFEPRKKRRIRAKSWWDRLRPRRRAA